MSALARKLASIASHMSERSERSERSEHHCERSEFRVSGLCKSQSTPRGSYKTETINFYSSSSQRR